MIGVRILFLLLFQWCWELSGCVLCLQSSLKWI